MSGSLPQNKNSLKWTNGLPANSEAELLMFLKSDVGLERGKEGEVVPKFLSTITQSVVAPNSEFIYGGWGIKGFILHYIMLIMGHSCLPQFYFSFTPYHPGIFIPR